VAKLQVNIVTGERVIYEESDVDVVVAPGADGELAILPSHAPLITLLAGGELRVTKGGQETSLAVFGGFLEVAENRVIVLADSAERADEIDVSRAESARTRAEESLAERGRGGVDLAEAELSMRRAAVRLRVGRRRGSRRGPPVGTGMDNQQ